MIEYMLLVGFFYIIMKFVVPRIDRWMYPKPIIVPQPPVPAAPAPREENFRVIVFVPMLPR